MTDQDEIYKAISSNQTYDPWGIPFDQQEEQIDIIEELLRQQAQGKEE